MNGIIIINKEKQYTSHDVVAKVKKILNVKKVGHTGTLDPNATGVLPLLLNDGTKLSKYLINHDKEYEVVLKLGIKTDTLDEEGKVIQKEEIDSSLLDDKKVKDTLKTFIGKQEQIPPMYSAIKVNGKKLYEYAREGKNIEIKPRIIEIYNIKLIKIEKEEKQISFRVECSKGTYIRSLCEDIAKKLGTIGYMKELNRTKVGIFDISNAISITELENNKNDIDFLNKHIITIEKLFKDYESIELEKIQLKKFLNGVKLKTKKEDGIYNIYCNNTWIGIGVVDKNFLKRNIINVT